MTRSPTLDLLRGVATVLYAGRNPALGGEAWRLEDDVELALARRAAPARVSFVSLGTRKVYAPSTNSLSETDRVGPVDAYGAQKLELEHALAAVLGPTADAAAAGQHLRLRAFASAPDLRRADAAGPRAPRRDPLRHEPVRAARLPPDRPRRRLAGRGGAAPAGGHPQCRLGRRAADGPAGACG